jgi:hypothetical protein
MSQLLLKIRELEEANAQITDQQAQTAVTLHSVQKDAESIRRVYEGLSGSEGIEWEIVADEDLEKGRSDKKPAGDDTIRFQSFRRSLDGAICRPMPSGEDHFADGITGNMQSTVNDTALNRIISNHKARKSVVGLFDAPRTSDLSFLETTDLTMPFATDADSACPGWSINDTLRSPALSALSLVAPSPIHDKGATLGTELGSEFGDDWGVNAGNHHLRNTSLYQLAMPSAPPSPIPASSPVQAADFSDDVSPELQAPVRGALQHSQDKSSRSRVKSSRRGHQTDRYQRLSQTIRSRTTQWADGRFKETLLGSKSISGQPVEVAETRNSVTPISRSLVGVFDSVVDALARPGNQEVTPSGAPDDEDSQKTMVKVDTSSTDANPLADNMKGAGNIIFELWLWLQFCIIILVFLWTMAKRGPKSVLEDSAKRRVSGTGHS